MSLPSTPQLNRIEAKIDHAHELLHAIIDHIAQQDVDAAGLEDLRKKLQKASESLQKSLDANK